MLPATLQFLIVMIASAINDRLQRKLDHVEEERRVLREQLEAATGGKELFFAARQRLRLAEVGKLPTPRSGSDRAEPAPHRSRETRARVAGSRWNCPVVSMPAIAATAINSRALRVIVSVRRPKPARCKG
jgi:hypothetical protein